MAEKGRVPAKTNQLFYFHLLIGSALLPQVQLDDLDVLRTVEDPAGEQSLHQDANAAEKHTEDEREQKNDSGQRKYANDEVADIVALAHRGRFVPRDLGFIVHGVEKLLRFTASGRSSHHINQRSSASREERRRIRLRAALQRAKAFTGDLRRGILNDHQRQRATLRGIILGEDFGIVAEVDLLGCEWDLRRHQRLRTENIFCRVFHSVTLRQVLRKRRQTFG